MGAGFCNLTSLGWLAEEKLTPLVSREQREKQAYRVGREEEGMSSNRPELVTLRECLEVHPDHENLLYLTDSEETLQVINKWIGGGAKLSLARSPDGDVLRAIIVKLQKRVQAGAATLLIKVKTHRGDPLNEEADIRAEMGRRKEENEKIWDARTDRTIYQWSEPSKQANYKHLNLWREERRSGVRNTYGEKVLSPFPWRGETS